jgi:TPP-dependent pyruvate/acetoin dehydrogenase alpha subunit
MYEAMFKNRCFEGRLAAVYMEGKQPKFDLAKGIFPGEYHSSSGQEPCAVGVMPHLRDDDWCGSTHRSHHVAIARGVSGKAMAAEMLGKKTGLCGGYGGHMHLFDARKKFSTMSIVGEGMPLALGAALSYKLRGLDNVAVTYIGEGAANQGAFHETLNMAGLWQLPLITIIEDNAWGISVSKKESTAAESNILRAAGYNMPGILIDDNDPYRIYEAAGAAVERARQGGGPTLIEIRTIRMEGHFMGDVEQYRPEKEKSGLTENDPISIFRARILAEKIISEAELERLEADVRSEVEAWIQFARDSEYPAPEAALITDFISLQNGYSERK